MERYDAGGCFPPHGLGKLPSMPDARWLQSYSGVRATLGAGPGVNPLGDEALAMLPQWWQRHPCSADAPGSAAAQGEASA